MTMLEQRPAAPHNARRDREVVAMPLAHQGLRDALIGSFSIPAVPQDLLRLLDRVR